MVSCRESDGLFLGLRVAPSKLAESIVLVLIGFYLDVTARDGGLAAMLASVCLPVSSCWGFYAFILDRMAEVKTGRWERERRGMMCRKGP